MQCRTATFVVSAIVLAVAAAPALAATSYLSGTVSTTVPTGFTDDSSTNAANATGPSDEAFLEITSTSPQAEGTWIISAGLSLTGFQSSIVPITFWVRSGSGSTISVTLTQLRFSDGTATAFSGPLDQGITFEGRGALESVSFVTDLSSYSNYGDLNLAGVNSVIIELAITTSGAGTGKQFQFDAAEFANAFPEPATIGLFALGAAGLACAVRRRRLLRRRAAKQAPIPAPRGHGSTSAGPRRAKSGGFPVDVTPRSYISRALAGLGGRSPEPMQRRIASFLVTLITLAAAAAPAFAGTSTLSGTVTTTVPTNYADDSGTNASNATGFSDSTYLTIVNTSPNVTGTWVVSAGLSLTGFNQTTVPITFYVLTPNASNVTAAVTQIRFSDGSVTASSGSMLQFLTISQNNTLTAITFNTDLTTYTNYSSLNVAGINSVIIDIGLSFSQGSGKRLRLDAVTFGQAVPEPATIGLFAFGAAGLAGAIRRRRRAAKPGSRL